MINASNLIIIISIIITIILFLFITIKIRRKKPELLKNSLVQIQQNDDATTINWTTIRSIIVASMSFGFGVYTIGGVVVFIFYRVLVLDGVALLIMAVIFSVYILTELDKFYTKSLKK